MKTVDKEIKILDFQGPFHYDHFDKYGNVKVDGNEFPRLNQPGIYIWGFMYYCDRTNKELKDLVIGCERYNEKTMQFIPYYVGLATGYISDRLRTHHNIRNKSRKEHQGKDIKGDAHKYTRLDANYFKNFFNDPNLPLFYRKDWGNKLNIQKILEFAHNYPHLLRYFNNDSVLRSLYPDIELNGKLNHWPITEQRISGELLEDPLEKVVSQTNNFWFCYAIVKRDFNIQGNRNGKDCFEKLETYTFWSLKGRTMSEIDEFPINLEIIKIIGCSNANIFKESPKDSFPGYL
jgi:hypothetical protein